MHNLTPYKTFNFLKTNFNIEIINTIKGKGNK